METSKEYYDEIISDYKSNGSGRSLRKYCMDEGVDYQWMMKARKEYSRVPQVAGTSSHFIPLSVEEQAAENTPDSSLKQEGLSWRVSKLVLSRPYGNVEISGGSMPALLSLMAKLK
mgnify:FL=1